MGRFPSLTWGSLWENKMGINKYCPIWYFWAMILNLLRPYSLTQEAYSSAIFFISITHWLNIYLYLEFEIQLMMVEERWRDFSETKIVLLSWSFECLLDTRAFFDLSNSTLITNNYYIELSFYTISFQFYFLLLLLQKKA